MRYRLTYFEGSSPFAATSEDSDLPFQSYIARIRGLRAAGGQGALPGLRLSNEDFTGAVLIELMSDMPDGSHGPPSNMYLLAAENTQAISLSQIKDRLEAAGLRNQPDPVAGVNFLCRLLDQTQKEALSLRRRIHELLNSPQICIGTDDKSSKGDTPEREGESSGAGMESSKREE